MGVGTEGGSSGGSKTGGKSGGNSGGNYGSGVASGGNFGGGIKEGGGQGGFGSQGGGLPVSSTGKTTGKGSFSMSAPAASSIQNTSPMASSVSQPTQVAPPSVSPSAPIAAAPGAGSGSGVISYAGGSLANSTGPDASDSLLDLYDQLMEAQRAGGSTDGGDLGDTGLAMFNSFPEFAASPGGKGLAIVALLGLVAGGVYLMRKAA